MKKKNKMKKIFKNLFIFSLICFFSSCEFFTDSFNAPVKEFFMDNTEAAAIELFEFSSETYKNSITEKLTVSSLQDANVVLYLRNPREYNFITSENMTSTFGSFLHSEYYLVQDENDKNIINLTIPKELLEKIEIESRNNEYNKSQNILIKLFHPVSKAEFLPFTLEFDCDTVPPKILSPVFYSTNSSYIDPSKQNHYVIAFNMPKKSEVCSLGVHNDLEKLLIDETAYEVSIADDGTISFPNYSEIVSGNVEDATGIEALNAKFFVQDDYQPFYIVTDKQLCSEGANATLSLVDKGNFSSKINVSSNTRTLGEVSLKANGKFFTSETGVIKINPEENENYVNITIIPPSVSVDLHGNEEPVPDVFVNYTLTNTDTNKVVETGSNNGSGSVTIDVPIGTYKLECISHKDNYADSVTTFGQINIQNIQPVYIYVSVNGDDNNGGTFSAPVKTIQKAVDKVIAMNVVTASSEGNPYKILLLSDITSDNSFESNNNALVNIDPSFASASETPLYLEISKSDDGNATINANGSDSNTGRVMYIGKNANVTLQNLILTGGYLLDKNGGGIYSEGNCNLNSCTILGNTAMASSGSVSGGGVYIESGSFTMEGCTISGNTAGSEPSDANAYGGGIYGASGTNITMKDTTISENIVASKNDVEGAGVYFSGTELTMNGGSISKNECSSDTSNFGGGVYINNSSTFTMTSGEISENSANYGGGVCVFGGTFKMKGGSISNNTADNNGGGVYVVKSNNTEPTFEISGDAYIEVGDNNDVYLTENQKITIAGDLSSELVARITPQSYAEKKQVLDAGDDTKLSDQQVGMFKVTQSDKFKTEITDEGCLKNTLNNAANLNADLYEICSTIIVKSADEMKAISNLSQTENEGKDFAGKTIILEEAFELDNTYKLIKTFSGVFDGNSKTIKLNKPSEYGYDSNEYFGGAIFNVITGKNAKVSDLTVEGTAYIAGIAIELKNDAVISNCTNKATITSPIGDAVHGCGGIVGELSNGGVIINCKNEGTITYNSTNDKGCGGIVGAISGTTIGKGNSIIANCINNEKIIRVQKEGGENQNASIGGICGKVTGKAAIYNCVNKGNVTSEITNTTSVTENIGGITGYCSVSFYEGEFPSLPADMGIFNCYNSGEISSSYNSDLKYIGGIVGKGEVYTSTELSLVNTIRVTNTVNNDDTTYAFGNITLGDSSTYFEIKDNFFKKGGSSPKYPSYESTFSGAISVFTSVVKTLNEYSIKSNGEYLQWRGDPSGSGDIIFSKEITGN